MGTLRGCLTLVRQSLSPPCDRQESSMNSSLAPTRVFQRTPQGQAIAAAPFASQLGQIHQRVLLLVNGFTPMAALDELAHLSGQAMQIAEDLLARGLITECDGAAGRPTRQLAH
jgi:hypothetical protein